MHVKGANMPVKRPYNAIAKLKQSIISAVDPGHSVMEGDTDSVDVLLRFNGADGVYYIREGFTQVGDEHIVHPGSFFEQFEVIF